MGLLLLPWLGLAGLLIAALICNIAITGIYGVSRTADYFGISRRAVTGWVARPLWVLLITAGLFALTRIPAFAASKPLFQLSAESVIFCIVVIPALWFVGMNPNLRSELQGLIAKILGKAKSKLKPTRA